MIGDMSGGGMAYISSCPDACREQNLATIQLHNIQEFVLATTSKVY